MVDLGFRPARGFSCGLTRIGWLLVLCGLLFSSGRSYAQPVPPANHRLAIHQEAVIAHGVLHYGEHRLLHQGEMCASLDAKIRGACYARMSRDALALAAGTPPTPACPVLAAQLADYFQASALLMNACAQGRHCFNSDHPVRVEILRGAVRHLITTGLNGVCD
ncbi:MAG: hypothetical protein M0003_10695 [Acidithiobacillus sp.]|nr:hypothetical protein [Acidithiobacillus sp.]